MATLSLPPTRPLHLPHKHTLAQGSFGRSSTVRPPVLSLFVRSSDPSIVVRSFMVRPIVRPFVHPNNLCSAVMLPKFPSFVRPIIWSFVHSFIVPIHHSSFVHRPYSSFVHSFVRPNNLCSAVMLPKFWLFVRPIIRSFVRSFIVPIHRSSFVHSHYSLFIVRSYELVTINIHRYISSLLFNVLFIIVTIHRHYSSSVLFIDVIHHRYYSSMISIVTFSSSLFIITIHRSSDHPNFNYSSIMLSSSPKTSQTNIPVIRTPVTVIFLPVRTFHLVTHPRYLQVEHA
jgi:hypothetical protein